MQVKWKIGIGTLAAAGLLGSVLVFNTLRLPDLPPPAVGSYVAVDGMPEAAERLGAAIRVQTVSYSEDAAAGAAADAFAQFHRLLETSFPLTHAALARDVINQKSLLYTWTGSEPDLPPLLLTAHMDVVPVEPGTERNWTYPPFSGTVAEGHIWGRGTLDMKHALMATLEGVERLRAQGFRPKRTILLAFGHDEELGGKQGAGAISSVLEQRKIKAWFSLDEGGFMLQGFFPGVKRPVAQIALSEKGYLSLALAASTQGGHSSVPPQNTAIGAVSRAVASLEAQPMPASLDGPGGAGLRALAPALPFAQRMALANDWLFGPLLKAQLGKLPATNAMIRTTTAPTMFNAGLKDNVLAAEARAVVNFRIAPGNTIAQVKTHAAQAIGNPDIKIKETGIPAVEASPVSNRNGPGYRLIGAALGEVAPDAIVVPGIVVGGTDSRHYARVSRDAYRFTPLRMSPGDVARYHGTDERISIANYAELIAFYAALMCNAAQ